MNLFFEGAKEAIHLIVSFDRQVISAAVRSVWISVIAVGIAASLGLPFGACLARRKVPGHRLLVFFARGAMSLPTVFIGLVCYGVFSRRGLLGSADLLYTPWAIVAGELILATPIIISLTHGAVGALDPRVGETALTLGASPWRRFLTYLSEARVGCWLAILTAFSRCVTELGIAMMVGGNIKDRTRTLATATALETGKGEFGRGLAMGGILLVVAISVSLAVHFLAGREQQRGAVHDD